MTAESVVPGRPLSASKTPEIDPLQERDFGFWLYLMSDAIIFALLFATYVVMTRGTDGGPTGQDVYDLTRASAETALLLTSTLTFGMASVAVASGNRNGVIVWLLVTAVLGLGFLSLEISEFVGMISEGAGPDRSGFLSAFFALVGTHGLHVTGGIVWIAVMIVQLLVKDLTPSVRSRLFRLGLFWHFLDIVWIGIFSVVYLPGIL
ncbi:cytochrome o ubiquinol oxidase subunit III [Microbaculum marinum]|uniref:Cytochrome bo(3) ubiquinol oxidase subunit 3 n=1 Tax=Microbaculum marinum TaxID=1764581 RepID=A0AAW9RKS3_9HYPH